VVDRTDFRARSKLLAAEIAAEKPDLLGLQEVALWRHGPMQLDHIGRPDAIEVDYDFLAILLADLANRGVRYEIVQVEQESDVEAPAFTGDPLAGTASSAEDVRLTDRDQSGWAGQWKVPEVAPLPTWSVRVKVTKR